VLILIKLNDVYHNLHELHMFVWKHGHKVLPPYRVEWTYAK